MLISTIAQSLINELLNCCISWNTSYWYYMYIVCFLKEYKTVGKIQGWE